MCVFDTMEISKKIVFTLIMLTFFNYNPLPNMFWKRWNLSIFIRSGAVATVFKRF